MKNLDDYSDEEFMALLARHYGFSETHLHRALRETFNETELRQLCRDLSLDYDALEGDDRAEKITALIAWMKRRQRLRQLVLRMMALRPRINQRQLFDLPMHGPPDRLRFLPWPLSHYVSRVLDFLFGRRRRQGPFP